MPARRSASSLLADQLRMVRNETERHLAEIDQQIRALPGPSRLFWRNKRFEAAGGFEALFA